MFAAPFKGLGAEVEQPWNRSTSVQGMD